ncbi:MAG: hypothetical protein HZC51_12065 [Nitrospirae bacterium]|nr:hypothetical protein [Nitrospirota bacterium]
MEIEYWKLAELGPGDRPYKAYRIDLERGYIRVMSSRLTKSGTVVSVNYFGKPDETGEVTELTRVDDKRQPVAEFEAELASFAEKIAASGLKMVIEEI